MNVRIRRRGQEGETGYESAAAIREAIARGELDGSDEYWAPRDMTWVPLDEHPAFSTTDARGIYPTIVHAVVFVKILVFVTFLALVRGTLGDLTSWGALYVYAILAGDAAAAALAYTNRNRAAAVVLWIFGVASFPLGLFLILSARMTRDFRYRAAE